MMTRRDFEAIAEVIADRTRHYGGSGCDYLYWHELVSDLAVAMKASNPRFNRDRFIRACSPKEP